MIMGPESTSDKNPYVKIINSHSAIREERSIGRRVQLVVGGVELDGGSAATMKTLKIT